MALTTYESLCGAVADWLERTDLAPRAADFVALAEARLNRQLRLAVMEGEARLTAAPGAWGLVLPADCGEALGLWREEGTGRRALIYRTPARLPVSESPGVPDYWTLGAAGVRFERPCAGETEFILRRVERLGLGPTAPVNAMLAEHPDLYLYGALAEAAPYLRDADMAALFLGRLELALAEARSSDARRHGRARLGTEIGPLVEAGRC